MFTEWWWEVWDNEEEEDFKVPDKKKYKTFVFFSVYVLGWL